MELDGSPVGPERWTDEADVLALAHRLAERATRYR